MTSLQIFWKSMGDSLKKWQKTLDKTCMLYFVSMKHFFLFEQWNEIWVITVSLLKNFGTTWFYIYAYVEIFSSFDVILNHFWGYCEAQRTHTRVEMWICTALLLDLYIISTSSPNLDRTVHGPWTHSWNIFHHAMSTCRITNSICLNSGYSRIWMIIICFDNVQKCKLNAHCLINEKKPKV